MKKKKMVEVKRKLWRQKWQSYYISTELYFANLYSCGQREKKYWFKKQIEKNFFSEEKVIY